MSRLSSLEHSKAPAQKLYFVQKLKKENYYVEWMKKLNRDFVAKVFVSKNLLIKGRQRELPTCLISDEIFLPLAIQMHQMLVVHEKWRIWLPLNKSLCTRSYALTLVNTWTDSKLGNFFEWFKNDCYKLCDKYVRGLRTVGGYNCYPSSEFLMDVQS